MDEPFQSSIVYPSRAVTRVLQTTATHTDAWQGHIDHFFRKDHAMISTLSGFSKH